MPERDPHQPKKAPLSLDQLLALNNEIAALVRAGMPLERGLLAIGADDSGGLSREMVALGERLSRGEGLAEAIAEEGDRFPRLYRAVVEAGLRAGRLSVALEGLASYARGFSETRRAIGLAFWYPLLVLLVADAVFVLLAVEVAPRLLAAFQSLGVGAGTPLRLLTALAGWVWLWAPAVPALVLAALFYWAWSGRAASLQPGRSRVVLRWVPWLDGMLRNAEAANFAELLALLLEHGVPYAEAIHLAAEATGDRAVMTAGRELATALELGDSPADALRDSRAFPPLLRWVLTTAGQQGSLVAGLRQLATLYRERALHQAQKIRVLLPTLLLLIIGASATVLYALTLFLPVAELLRGLSTPPAN